MSLRDEESIVWLENPADHPYVRVTHEYATTRQRPICCPGTNPAGKLGKAGRARTIGYAVLKPKAQSLGGGCFQRRVFHVTDWDRINGDSWPEGHENYGHYRRNAPSEAVDPLTLAAGVEGHKTERCPIAPPSGTG